MTKDARPYVLKVGDRVEIVAAQPTFVINPEYAEGVFFTKISKWDQQFIGKFASVVEISDANYYSPVRYALDIDGYGFMAWFNKEQLKHQS